MSENQATTTVPSNTVITVTYTMTRVETVTVGEAARLLRTSEEEVIRQAGQPTPFAASPEIRRALFLMPEGEPDVTITSVAIGGNGLQ